MTNEMDREYEIDGDNDIFILIDPSLANFAHIHNDIVNRVCGELRNFRQTRDVQEIESFIRDALDRTEIVPSERRDFVTRGDVSQERGLPHFMYVSNAEYVFPSQEATFSLRSMMVCVRSGNVSAGCEVLHISIPRIGDSVLDHYVEY